MEIYKYENSYNFAKLIFAKLIFDNLSLQNLNEEEKWMGYCFKKQFKF